jgi:hypothetical protein
LVNVSILIDKRHSQVSAAEVNSKNYSRLYSSG